MRVCIDAQSAIAQWAGVGRYTRELVRHLGALAGEDELRVAYFDFLRRGDADPWPGGVPVRAIRWCPGRMAQFCWKKLAWPPYDRLAGRADVYHFPNFVLPPLSRGRGVVTIHDMSFVRFPHFAEARNLDYLRGAIRDTVRRAAAVVTVSEFSAAEVRELTNADASRVVAIHPGISEAFRPPADPAAARAAAARLGLDRPYLLTVGTLEPRKNLPFLVEVFERMTEFDGLLAIVGRRGWKWEPIVARIRASRASDRIRLVETVGDDALPLVYAGAEAFVLASHYEGFGFPPLEAMACGTPVVSSAGGSLPEVLGDGADIVAGFDADAWAARLLDLLRDGARRTEQIERGRRRAARFTWAETARRTWEVYRRVDAGEGGWG